MPFVLPNFNIECQILRGSWLPSNPIGITVWCQLRAPSASNAANAIPSAGATVAMNLLLPPGTDIRDSFTAAGTSNADFVEVPKGSKRIYRVWNVDDIAKGFANEHRFAILTKVAGYPWPVPIP